MKPKHLRRILPVVVVLAIAIVLITRHQRGNNGPLRVSGTVEATEARLGFDVPGRLAEVLVHEGDRVTAGEAVARLDTTEAAARLAQARAQEASAAAMLQELLRGSRTEEIAQARAAASAARDHFAQAQQDKDRAQILFDGGAISIEAHDKAVTAFQVAEDQAKQAEEQLRLVESGPRRERIEAQRAALSGAGAAIEAAAATIDHMTARAPFAGVVTVRHREPGETMAPGNPAITIMNPDDRWVRIYVPEDRVGRVRLGGDATITSDSYPGKSYRGEVVYIASEAEFTPKNVQTAEERVKLVYAVKVRVTGDAEMQLKPGMPADVELQEGPAS